MSVGDFKLLPQLFLIPSSLLKVIRKCESPEHERFSENLKILMISRTATTDISRFKSQGEAGDGNEALTAYPAQVLIRAVLGKHFALRLLKEHHVSYLT